jgi:hypothetical protein
MNSNRVAKETREMKTQTIYKSALPLLTFGWVLIGCGEHKEQQPIPATTSNNTVQTANSVPQKKPELKTQITVDQSYEKDWYGSKEQLPDFALPIENVCTGLLRAAGTALPDQEVAQKQALLKIVAKGTALGRAYMTYQLQEGGVGTPMQRPSWNGAEVSGSVVLEYGGKSIQKEFAGRKPLSDSFSERRAATNAPLNEVLFYQGSLVPAVLEAVSEMWGITTNTCPPLKEAVNVVEAHP